MLHIRSRPPEDREARPRERGRTACQDPAVCRKGATHSEFDWDMGFAYVAVVYTQAMQAARQELELTQKDVAQKVNEKPNVIQEYESGRAIPNPQILGKLERVLKVKLRGMCSSYNRSERYTHVLHPRRRHWEEDGRAEKVIF